jgi:amino acid transporter
MSTTLLCAHAVVYLVGQLVPIVLGVVFTIFFVKRTKNQLLKGYYREGQGGFFGEYHGFVEKLLSPFAVGSVTGIAFTFAGLMSLFRHLGPRIKLTSMWVPPLVMVFLLFIFCVLSFFTSRFLLRLYLNRKFGFEIPLLDNEEKGSIKR